MGFLMCIYICECVNVTVYISIYTYTQVYVYVYIYIYIYVLCDNFRVLAHPRTLLDVCGRLLALLV